MVQKQKKPMNKKTKIALATTLPVIGLGALAAAIAIPLTRRDVQQDVIPYEAYTVVKTIPQHHSADSEPVNVLRGFDAQWLSKNDLTKYKIMEIPADVEYIDPAAFYVDDGTGLKSTIPANIEQLCFAPRSKSNDLQVLGLAENCFREAPFKSIALPNHFGGTFSLGDMNQPASARVEGAFRDCPNVNFLDLSAIEANTANVLMDKMDFNTFYGWPASGVIEFNSKLSTLLIEGLKTALCNCGIISNLWFGGITPRATTVNMDENGIVTGFSPLATADYIATELYAYDNSGILRMPAGAKGIADNAFANWGGFPEIKSVIKGITFKDWDERCEIQYIGKNAFKGCGFAEGTKIIIPQSITEIGERAFAGITTLYNVEFVAPANEQLRTFGPYAFEGDINLALPEFANSGVKTISEGMFAGCTNIPTNGTLVIEASIEKIETNAFDDCGINSLIINPKNKLTIGTEAFKNNYIQSINLASISDTEKIELEEHAFPSYTGDSGTIYCHVYDDITDIWRWQNKISKKIANAGIVGWNFDIAIDDLYSLLYKVDQDATTQKYYINGFNPSLTQAEIDDLINQIEQPEDKQNVTLKFPSTIGTGGNAKQISAVGGFGTTSAEYFPENIKTIDFSNFSLANSVSIVEYGFYDIDTIENINFNDAVETIGKSAFQYCDGIEAIELREGIAIKTNAFNNCKGLWKIDISNWTQSWITSHVTCENPDCPIEAGCFSGVVEDGWLVLPKLDQGIAAKVGAFFSNPDGPDLPSKWTEAQEIIVEPENKTTLTKATQKTGQLVFDLAEAAQEFTLDWRIELIEKGTSTKGVKVKYTETATTVGGVDTQLIINLEFVEPQKLNNDDHFDFDVHLYAKSQYEQEGEVTYTGYSFQYTGTATPQNGVQLSTDIFNSRKQILFDIHDWEIKDKNDLTVVFTPKTLGSTDGVTTELLGTSFDKGTLTLSVEMSKNGLPLENGDVGCFSITISRNIAGITWSETWDDGSLTYCGYTIHSDQAGVVTTTNNKDYEQFHLVASGSLAEYPGMSYFAKVTEITIPRDSENIKLAIFDNSGNVITDLKANDVISLDNHKDIYLNLGLAVTGLKSSQVLANDSATFKLEYGYKITGSEFKSIGITEQFTLKIANSMINVPTGKEKQLTMAGGDTAEYQFVFNKPWTPNTNLKMQITSGTGEFAPLFSNGESIETTTPAVGSTSINVPLMIQDISTLTDGSTSNFGISFSAMQGENTIWTKEITSLQLQYVSPRVAVVKKDKLVAIGAAVPYVVYEFDVKSDYDTEFNVEITNHTGTLTPTLSSSTYYATNKKFYVRVNFNGQAIETGSECGLTLKISKADGSWTQIVKDLTAKDMVNFSDTGDKQMTQYNAWTGQYALNLQQALETSQHETIKITDFVIDSAGSDTNLTIGKTATTNGTKAYFDYTISSKTGKSILEIDKNASNYWAEFSCKVQIVNGDGTLIYEQQLSNLMVTLSGVPIYSGYYDHEAISTGTVSRDIPFDVAEDFKVGTNYWKVKWVETQSGNTKVNENATVVSITGKKLTLRITFDSTAFIIRNSTEGYFIFYYYANGDALSGGSPTWTFTTTGNAFKYW